MQHKEPFGNVEIGRRIYLVMDNVSISFIEEIEPNSTLTPSEFAVCLSSSFRNAARRRPPSVRDRKPLVPSVAQTNYRLSPERCRLRVDRSSPDSKT